MPDRRPITPLVRRRAWGELGVRPWTFLALLLTIAAAVLAFVRGQDWRYEKRVIETGVPLTAEVVQIGVGEAARQGSRDEQLGVGLQYTPPNSSSPLQANGYLPRKPGTSLALKDILHIHVDPGHPEYWTERTEPSPLGLAMITPLLALIVAAGCAAIATAKRLGVMRAYRSADPRRATVVSVRQSPLAPFSKLLGVTLDAIPGEPADRRVRDCYWPNRCGTVHAKQTIDVLTAKRRTFAAVAYEVPTAGLAGDVLS